jgi:hypothetical protein
LSGKKDSSRWHVGDRNGMALRDDIPIRRAVYCKLLSC